MQHLTTFFLATAGVLLSSLASAQEKSNPPDQIIVTGARSPLQLADIGNAVTIIDRETIERRQVRNVAELLRSVPGFSVSRTGVVGSQTQIRVRGAEANQLLVLVDGTRVNDPATGDEFRWEHLSSTEVERIEVIRGAQSALWGSDAIGGIVHIITRKSDAGTRSGGFVEGGSFGTRNAGANGAYGGDRWSLSGGVEHLETDGQNIARVGDEEDGADLTTLFANAAFDLSDQWRFDIGARAVDAYSQFDAVDFATTGLPTDTDNATETNTLTAHASIQWQTADAAQTHQLALRYFDSDNLNLTDGLESASTAADRTTIAYQYDFPIGDNGMSLALEHERSDFTQRGAIIFGDPNQDQQMDTTSVVADFRGLAPERFSWLLSARFDDNSDFKDAFNGRLSLAYTLTDNTRLRGNIGTGRKNPTFTERFGFFPGQFIGNADLEPERSTSIELGVDQTLLSDAVQLQLTAFHQDLTNEIDGFVFDPATFLSTAQNRDGKSERQGAEVSAQWSIHPQFDLAASYTYTDATEPDTNGNEIDELRRPQHTGSVSLDLRALDDRLTTNLTADYGGARNDLFFPPFPAPRQTVRLQSFWLLSLAAQYAVTPSVSVYLRGSNLLDKEYEEVFGYRTLGRAGFVGVRMQFGE